MFIYFYFQLILKFKRSIKVILRAKINIRFLTLNLLNKIGVFLDIVVFFFKNLSITLICLTYILLKYFFYGF